MRALLRAMLAVGVCLGASAPAQADTLYRFVDEHGVIHFSNQPNDSRYVAVRTFGTSGTLWRPRAARSPWRARNITAYDDLIADEARSNGVPPGMVKAVIAAESNFNPQAVSRKGAQGLMQLMPATAEFLGVEDPFHVEQNVRGGSRYLARLFARYGDWSRTLAAYNAGPEAVDRHGGIPPYAETREYVDRVLAYYRRYDAEFDR